MIINVGEGGGVSNADKLKYDNETSGLSAENVQEAIDELDVELETVKTSFQAGCNTIVSSITAQGVTPKSNSPADISTAINTVATNKYNAGVTATKVGTATVAQVLSGKTFTNSSGVGLTGTMADKGAVTGSITTSGGTYTIPAGYHNGGGKVTGATLAQLVGTNVTLESAGNLLSGVTAYGKNGTKYTGSMANKSGTSAISATASLDSSNKRVKMAIPANGYHSTSNYLYNSYSSMASVIGLTADKIVKGNTILGIAGTFESKVYTSFLEKKTSTTSTFYEVGFRPKVIFTAINGGAFEWYLASTNKHYNSGFTTAYNLGSFDSNNLHCYDSITDTGFYFRVGSAYHNKDMIIIACG